MSLKKIRGGVTGFGDTLVSKTCLFFLGSHVRGGGGVVLSGILPYMCIVHMHVHVLHMSIVIVKNAQSNI